ncbi:MAG: deoxyuridine 5'-triphosphate nucleotidohydrolase [Clostridiales bacterium]|nr:deoxyuridine 5'-triphosphate nucleotidohydrolase [Clostridiales bacterium]
MRIKLIDFGGKTPVRKHYNDAGADVYSPRDQTIYPGQVYSFPLGFGLELPDGFTGFIFPRSSLSAKGIVCELPPIDSGYRGEIHAVVSNVGNDGYDIKEGDRIGQLVILPCMIPEFTYEDAAERGTGAFGSSGK